MGRGALRGRPSLALWGQILAPILQVRLHMDHGLLVTGVLNFPRTGSTCLAERDTGIQIGRRQLQAVRRERGRRVSPRITTMPSLSHCHLLGYYCQTVSCLALNSQRPCTWVGTGTTWRESPEAQVGSEPQLSGLWLGHLREAA